MNKRLEDMTLVELEARLIGETTDGWANPQLRSEIEYTARQALYALRNFKYHLTEYEEAVINN